MMQPLSACKTVLAAVFCTLIASACSSGGSGGDPVVNQLTSDNEPPVLDTDSPADDSPTDAPVGTQGYQRDLAVEACSIEDLNAWVDFDMRDYYIYYDQVPQLNLADYTDPAELVRDLRVDPDVFSFLTDAEEQDNLFSLGITGGYGFNAAFDAFDVYRFRQIRDGSPMQQAGISRGDRWLAIDGVPFDDQMTSALFNELLFSEGAEPFFTVQTDGEAPRTIQVIAAEYSWNTSPYASIFTMADGQRIGYLPVEAFYQTTEGEMDSNIEWLLSEGIDDFILDLRQNRGGSVRVSERLASQIAGPALVGEPFQIRTRNDKYSELNYTSFITPESPTLSVPRIAILTSERSASASETVINGLQPYLDVTVIGSLTSGKPFTSRPIEYCERNLNAMHSLRTNSVGVSILGGIQPDCAVQDEWSYPTNDSRDALTSAALSFLNEGVCNTQVAASLQPRNRNLNRSFGAEPSDSLTDMPISLED